MNLKYLTMTVAMSLMTASCSPDSNPKGTAPLRTQSIPVNSATMTLSGALDKKMKFSKDAGDDVNCFYVGEPDTLIVEVRRPTANSGEALPSEYLWLSLPRSLGLNGTFTVERQDPHQYVNLELEPESGSWFARSCTAKLQKSGGVLDVSLECLGVRDLDGTRDRLVDLKAEIACSTTQLDSEDSVRE